MALCELGDVHQALDALVDAHERAERNELGDLARHNLTHAVGACEVLPRIFLGCLQRQGDALAVHVDVENLDSDLLANLDNLGRMVDVLPGQLGHVHETVDAAEINEGAEVDDGRDDAGADLALLQLGEEGLANFTLGLLEPRATREHNVVAVLVQLDDLRLENLADVRLKVAHTAHLDERCGKEAAEADVDDQAALDDLDDGTFDDAIFFLDLLDGSPCTLVLCALLREDEAAFLVLLGENEGLDDISHGDHLAGVNIVLDGELAGRDDAFGLVADVEENLVTIDLDDGAFDDVAIVEVLDGGINGSEEILSRADVVDGDLGGTGGDSH